VERVRLCTRCGEPLEINGLTPFVGQLHAECGLREACGGIGDQLAGVDWSDPPGVSKRDAARLAWAWLCTYGPRVRTAAGSSGGTAM
jgi:hypothetical protein